MHLFEDVDMAGPGPESSQRMVDGKDTAYHPERNAGRP